MNMNSNNDNRNLILALVLMTAVWFGFSLLFPTKPQPPVAETKPAAVAAQATATPAPAAIAPLQSPPAATPMTPSREITVETANYRAIFTSAGARLVAFELKGYRQQAGPDAPRVELIPRGGVRQATLRTTGSGGLALTGDAPFVVEGERNELSLAGSSTETLTFRHVASSGVEVVKTFTFQGDSYAIGTAVAVRNAGPSPLSGALELTLTELWDASKKDSYSFAGPALLLGDKLEQVDVRIWKRGEKFRQGNRLDLPAE